MRTDVEKEIFHIEYLVSGMLFTFHLTDIYSRRSYMGRCSLPISPRRPFVPLPLCANNKHGNQDNRLSPVSQSRATGSAREREYAPNAPNAPVSDEIYPLALYSLCGESHECDKRQEKRGTRPGPAIKSPTNDKQISHSGSPIYRCRNTLPHT